MPIIIAIMVIIGAFLVKDQVQPREAPLPTPTVVQPTSAHRDGPRIYCQNSPNKP